MSSLLSRPNRSTAASSPASIFSGEQQVKLTRRIQPRLICQRALPASIPSPSGPEALFPCRQGPHPRRRCAVRRGPKPRRARTGPPGPSRTWETFTPPSRPFLRIEASTSNPHLSRLSHIRDFTFPDYHSGFFQTIPECLSRILCARSFLTKRVQNAFITSCNLRPQASI